jgi:hypothetical protein
MTLENFYLMIIVVLMMLQMYQFKLIGEIKKDATQIWDQMAILSLITSKILGDAVNKKKQESNAEDTKI